jgi:hypothetical protein
MHIYLREIVHNSEPCNAGLQAIQVVFTTLEHQWGKVTFPGSGKELQGFVDRGVNSPWQNEDREVEDKNRPYYLLYSEMKKTGMDTSKGATANRPFDFYDAPISLVDHQETYFETAMICVDYHATGMDNVIASYRWGWIDYGTRFKPRWDVSANRLEVSVASGVSQEFMTVLKTEYAVYAANLFSSGG